MGSQSPRIHLHHDDVIHWRENASLTNQAIDNNFSIFATLTRELRQFGWIWDVVELNPPAPGALRHFLDQAKTFAARTRHLAIRTESNIGLWLTLRHVLPGSGFGSISVHRGFETALLRAGHG